jgi:hypothetical protein
MQRFFESNYLVFEITSNENTQFILDSIRELRYLEDNENNTWKHAETGGYYFDQRPIGGERPFPLVDRHISVAETSDLLVSVGLGQTNVEHLIHDGSVEAYRTTIHGATCYSNSSYAVFFTSVNNRVERLWLDMNDDASHERDRIAVANFLNHVGAKYALILVDWYKTSIVDLSSKAAIEAYMLEAARDIRKD